MLIKYVVDGYERNGITKFQQSHPDFDKPESETIFHYGVRIASLWDLEPFMFTVNEETKAYSVVLDRQIHEIFWSLSILRADLSEGNITIRSSKDGVDLTPEHKHYDNIIEVIKNTAIDIARSIPEGNFLDAYYKYRDQNLRKPDDMYKSMYKIYTNDAVKHSVKQQTLSLGEINITLNKLIDKLEPKKGESSVEDGSSEA